MLLTIDTQGIAVTEAYCGITPDAVEACLAVFLALALITEIYCKSACRKYHLITAFSNHFAEITDDSLQGNG